MSPIWILSVQTGICCDFHSYEHKHLCLLSSQNAHKISAFADVQGQASHYRTLLMWVTGHFKAVQSDS